MRKLSQENKQIFAHVSVIEARVWVHLFTAKNQCAGQQVNIQNDGCTMLL